MAASKPWTRTRSGETWCRLCFGSVRAAQACLCVCVFEALCLWVFMSLLLHVCVCMCVYVWAGLKKALAAATMVLGRASEADRTLTLKRIKAKSVELSDQKLVDYVIPPDGPAMKSAIDSLVVRAFVHHPHGFLACTQSRIVC